MASSPWDTSALGKLYLPERGSDRALALARDSIIVLSSITPVEFASALRRRVLMGELTVEQRDLAYQRFFADSRGFQFADPNDAIRGLAVKLLHSEPRIVGRLRALDAIQLATAIWWFERATASNIEAGAFIVADRSLREAAVALGLAVENPEDYE